MPNFNILLNGAAIPNNKLIIPASASESRNITLVHVDGPGAVGKLVKIQTSSLVFISDVMGALDVNGQFVFTIGPSFGAKGDLTLSISVGTKQKSLEVRFV